MTKSAAQPGIFSRIGLAMRVLTRGGFAEAAEFIRRAGQAKSYGSPDQPYRAIPALRSAVSRKAVGLASMPLMISTADDRLVESGPLFDLIDRPNPRQSRKDFWKASSAWLDLTGVVHWIMVGVKTTGRPTAIIPVGKYQMKPRFDSGVHGQGDLVGWKFRPAGHRWDEAIDLDLDEVWTVGEDTFDANDPFGFVSPLESAGLAIAQLYKADMANNAALDNDMAPAGVMTMPNEPSEQQIKDTRAELDEFHSGAKNRRRPMLLYGGLDWKPIASTFNEMEFSTLQKMKIVDVCSALEVDPAAIGYYEGSNYAHSESAKASLWIDTIIPRGQWLADEFDRGIVSKFEDDRSLSMRDALRHQSNRSLTFGQRNSRGYRSSRAQPGAAMNKALFTWFDDSRVPAVRKANLERSKEGAIWITEYKAPPANVIECLDLPLPTHPWQEHGWQKTGEMMIDETPPEDLDAVAPVPILEGDGTEEDDATDITASAHPRKMRDQDPVLRELTEESLAKIWLNWRRSWAGLEKSVKGRIARHFMALRSETLKNLERVMEGKKAATITRDTIGEIVFDIVAANGKLNVTMMPMLRASFELGGQQSMDEASIAAGDDQGNPFNMNDPEVSKAIRRRQINLARINRTVQKELRDSLAEGVNLGETTAQLGDRIRGTFNIANSRAQTIARTETGGGVEAARQIGRDQAKVPYKSWLWSRKETGRQWHHETETESLANPIPNDQKFIIVQTLAQTLHPRGEGLRAIDAVNCACTTIARYPGDGVKDLRLVTYLTVRGFLTFEQLTHRNADRFRGKDAA